MAVRIVVDKMPEYWEECPFVYTKIETRETVWCRNGYTVPVDYCGFSQEPCDFEHCKYLKAEEKKGD